MSSIQPVPKPKKPRSERDRWVTFRRRFLKDQRTWEGYYLCTNCGRPCISIDVHHVIKRSVRPDLVYEASNLILLCRDCHTKHHQGLGA